MRRRDFMRRLLGGAAAALAGTAVPRDLDAAEMALLEERVGVEWRNGKLVVTNPTRNEIVVHANLECEIPTPGEFWQIREHRLKIAWMSALVYAT